MGDVIETHLFRTTEKNAVDKVMHESLETQTILQRMEEVRCELDEDVQEIVEGARVMGKWRYYVKTYPWICLGAALAGGYLIVPRVCKMQRGVQMPVELANPSRLLATPNGGVRNALLTAAGNWAVREVLRYVGQQADKLLAPQSVPKQDQP